jgi:hypothetical protein
LSVNSIRVDSELRVDLKLQESTLHREKTFMNSTSAYDEVALGLRILIFYNSLFVAYVTTVRNNYVY